MTDDAFLVVDKPQGLTSQQVVARVKRRLRCRKIGHTGTLDPLATGVLPLALNRATRLIQYLDESRKVYSGEIELGVESDTLDRDGEIVARHDGPLTCSESEVAEVFRCYLGQQTQIAPIYSAIKRNGKPLYAYARAGVEVIPPERQVEIDSFTLLSYNPPLVAFRVVCSRGTYVRSLAADVGRDLGCGARIWSLRREVSGPFTLDQAISLDDLLAKIDAGEDLPWLAPLDVITHLPKLVVSESAIKDRIAHGRAVPLNEISASLTGLEAEAELVLIDESGTLLALARLNLAGENEELRMLRVMMPQNLMAS
ncbi:MAG: tRNA pseudouridine(55) synthase TruB [Deltaproteobacteria bacterium]|nr:tRNA pseudouridine(55) synthase TruB [Candidatus Tharpella sp.]